MSFSNNITIEKVWQDDDFFEVKISCSSESIYATTNVYVTTESITRLYTGLKKFCDNEISSFKWLSGDMGDETTACVSFLFFRTDTVGHITVEVFMEIDDGASFRKHNCCFYIHTELGLLYSFLEKLPKEQGNIHSNFSKITLIP